MNTDRSSLRHTQTRAAKTVATHTYYITNAIQSGSFNFVPTNKWGSIVHDINVGRIHIPPIPYTAPTVSTIADRPVASLTTSLASYNAALPGSWVSITSAEYQMLVVGDMVTIPLTTTKLGNSSRFSIFVTNVANAGVQPANVYAFAVDRKRQSEWARTWILFGLRKLEQDMERALV